MPELNCSYPVQLPSLYLEASADAQYCFADAHYIIQTTLCTDIPMGHAFHFCSNRDCQSKSAARSLKYWFRQRGLRVLLKGDWSVGVLFIPPRKAVLFG